MHSVMIQNGWISMLEASGVFLLLLYIILILWGCWNLRQLYLRESRKEEISSGYWTTAILLLLVVFGGPLWIMSISAIVSTMFPNKVISYHRQAIYDLSRNEDYSGNYADPQIFKKTAQKDGGVVLDCLRMNTVQQILKLPLYLVSC